MAQRRTPLVPGEYFHIYNRGNSKQKIFFDDKDRERFVKLLYLCNSTSNRRFNFRDDIIDRKIDAWDFDRGDTLVSIGAWALMPNHFHLYVTPSPKTDLGEKNIPKFMRKFMTAYTKYLNIKHSRTGALYEGPFKSVHIKDDNQAKYLFSYIHLNPIKLFDSMWREKGIKNLDLALQYLASYEWSSYHDHRGILRPQNKILKLEDFPGYFSNIQNFDAEIISWLQYVSPIPGMGEEGYPQN